MKRWRKEQPRLTWPPDADGGDNLGLRFEIVAGEWDNGERAICCNHQPVLDVLNDVLDRLAQVTSLLEIACRSLFNGGGN